MSFAFLYGPWLWQFLTIPDIFSTYPGGYCHNSFMKTAKSLSMRLFVIIKSQFNSQSPPLRVLSSLFEENVLIYSFFLNHETCLLITIHRQWAGAWLLFMIAAMLAPYQNGEDCESIGDDHPAAEGSREWHWGGEGGWGGTVSGCLHMRGNHSLSLSKTTFITT